VANRRVYQVAREFDLSSEALLKLLTGLGYSVKSHMSTVSDEMIQAVQRKFEADKEATKRADKEKKIKQARAKEQARRRRPPKPKKAPKAEAAPKEKEPKRRKKGKRSKRARPRRRKVDQAKVKMKVKETLARIERGDRIRKRRHHHTKVSEGVTEETRKLRVAEFVSVSELAKVLGVEPTELIAKLMELGLLVTINQRLDFDTIATVADEYGYEVELLPEYGAELFQEAADEDEEDLERRPPVVTVMGHVDHGKTSLLDYIRKTNVIEGESGGITQHIGAYSLVWDSQLITFLDTPGHQAFTAMRARGAQVTDMCVLVVAADDGVMPQTVEAIDHARAASIPVIVAINKVDLPSASPDRVKRDLAEHGILVEDYGGDVMSVEVSAKTGEGIDALLEAILVQAETLELKANSTGWGRGTVIESRVDPGKGSVATVLIQQGSLTVGDAFVAGQASGRVRAMYDEWERNVDIALPATPVQVLGFDELPYVGDSFLVVEDERRAREIGRRRKLARREQLRRASVEMSLRAFQEMLKLGETKELKVVLKGDVAGSVEALSDSIEGLTTEEVKLTVIHRGVGPINESDVLLASASKAIIVGFHVSPDTRARDAAQRNGVEIRLYDVIYEAIDDIKAAMTGLLEPEYHQVVTGNVEVREVYHISRVGTIAGSYVKSGVVTRGCLVRLIRDNQLVFEGKISSLKRFKDDVREVTAGFECGIGVEGYDDFCEGDILEMYRLEEVRKSLT
jgi:translation initiation factor IF-2